MIEAHPFNDLDSRAREVFRHIVETYVMHGEPVGSRTLSKSFGFSPATLRNVMSDLEDLGLLYSPHISAGRIPSERGLRFFVDGVMERGSLSATERAALEQECTTDGSNIDTVLERAGDLLSGLSASAGLVVIP